MKKMAEFFRSNLNSMNEILIPQRYYLMEGILELVWVFNFNHLKQQVAPGQQLRVIKRI